MNASSENAITSAQPAAAVEIVPATTPEQIAAARALFLEYAQSLGFSLCFQSFEKELAELPGSYAPPAGRLLLAKSTGVYAGCVALHALAGDACEMKRLYVRPGARGRQLGRRLAERVIGEARQIGYARMRLDTIPGVMDSAIALYRRLGFREVPPCCHNPVAGASYMELTL